MPRFAWTRMGQEMFRVLSDHVRLRMPSAQFPVIHDFREGRIWLRLCSSEAKPGRQWAAWRGTQQAARTAVPDGIN